MRKDTDIRAGRSRMREDDTLQTGKRFYVSVVLLLLAIISVTAATAAWFTIADHTKVQSMSLEIYSGAALRFDLDPHQTLDEYTKTLSFDEIYSRIVRETGMDEKELALEPVTTSDYSVFTLENGSRTARQEGKYLEFTLHFMAAEDMVVHLTSEHSEGREDGTGIFSETPGLAEAMRISFTAGDHTAVYDPGGMDEISGSEASSSGHTFHLPEPDDMVYNDENALFSLSANQDLPVTVHIWLEGTDEACTDSLRSAEYSIRLRFEGTDTANRRLDGTDSRPETEQTEE